jgi:S1-C subfamily serine protease
MLRFLSLLIPAALMTSCMVSPPPRVDRTPPDGQSLAFASQRITALVVTKQTDITSWIARGFSQLVAPKDADGGTACPISPDGYFITADHVVKNSATQIVHVIYGRGSRMQTAPARVIWRDTKHDLALLHAPLNTPNYYQFTSPEITLPAGTPIFHGGITTGLKPIYGALSSDIPAQRGFGSAHRFRIDIPLQPGDSGGPILDARARLIGVNSSVEFLVPLETPIFTESQGIRPHVAQIRKLIEQDRRR